MLTVPDDVIARFPREAVHSEPGVVVRYQGLEPLMAEPVLVTRPTFVMVRSGTKQLTPQGGEEALVAGEASVVAMRSGTHLMSELRGTKGRYASTIVSIDRSFLRRALGAPASVPAGPRVAVSSPRDRVTRLFDGLPRALRTAASATEREFKLRELIVHVTADEAVRRVMFAEAADWGRNIAERIVSVTTVHCLSPVQVPDLARLCAMSLSSFKRHFRATYGIAPGRWLSQVRLEHARALVLNSDQSIRSICEASGYGDLSNFIRAFRRAFGHSPTALRRREERVA